MAALLAGLGGLLFFTLWMMYFYLRSQNTAAQTRNRVAELTLRAGRAENRQARRSQKTLRASLLRLWDWIMHAVGNRIKRMTPRALYEALDRRIIYAGKQHLWNAGTFFVVMVFSGILMTAFMAFFVLHGSTSYMRDGLLLVLFFGFGLFVPWFALSVLVSRRQGQILMQLSGVMDLLCVSVEAGLSFEASLDRLSQYMEGPLIDEFRRALRDMRMGMTRRQALTALSDRCHLQPVQLFTAAVIQSETLGVGLADTLRIQADNMRDRYKQLMREKAMKLPVKLIFPLAIFIFPTIFIVVLGPAILTFMSMGSHMFGG